MPGRAASRLAEQAGQPGRVTIATNMAGRGTDIKLGPGVAAAGGLLIEVVRPDAFVKGGDYTREQLPEAPLVEALGGVLHILPLVDNRSTTGVIQRIRSRRGSRPKGPVEQRESCLVSPPG